MIGVDLKNVRKMVTFGVLLISFGIIIIFKDSVIERREKVFSQMNLELTELFSEEALVSDNVSDVNNNVADANNDNNNLDVIVQDEATKNVNVTNYESYAGVLEIPKIGFNRGFYKKESNLNNVKFNLKILPQSNYPDEENGNVIIIGHSGNYSNSYFGNLYQLANEDIAIINYNDKKYTYKIINIYTDKKDGTVTVYRDETKNCLTLITCTKDDNTTQTIYILERVSVE